MKYDFKKTLLKGLKYFIIFIIPFLVDKFIINYPELAQITVGSLLVMTANFLKVRVGLRLP